MMQAAFVRPDRIMRTSVIDPFSVRAEDPVQFARHTIDPFIQAIRPEGPVSLDGGLGIVTVDRLSGLPTGNEFAYGVMGLVAGGLLAWFMTRRGR